MSIKIQIQYHLFGKPNEKLFKTYSVNVNQVIKFPADYIVESMSITEELK